MFIGWPNFHSYRSLMTNIQIKNIKKNEVLYVIDP